MPVTEVILGLGEQEVEVMPPEEYDRGLYLEDIGTQIGEIASSLTAVIILGECRLPVDGGHYLTLSETAYVGLGIEIDPVLRRLQIETVAGIRGAEILHQAIALLVVVIVHDAAYQLQRRTYLLGKEDVIIIVLGGYVAGIVMAGIIGVIVFGKRPAHVGYIAVTPNIVEILQDIVAYPPPVGLVVLIGTTP